MTNSITPDQRAALREREVARWDGHLLTLDTYLLLDPPPGPVAVVVELLHGADPRPDRVDSVMARVPTADELVSLIRSTADNRTAHSSRIVVVVRVRSLEENEARAAWGDR